MRPCKILTLALLILAIRIVPSQGSDERQPSQPNVAGAWTGTWGQYPPEAGKNEKHKEPMRLDCIVVPKRDGWEATFEGECGRPYKYTIKMDGRQAGQVVLFKGTTDLGEKD